MKIFKKTQIPKIVPEVVHELLLRSYEQRAFEVFFNSVPKYPVMLPKFSSANTMGENDLRKTSKRK